MSRVPCCVFRSIRAKLKGVKKKILRRFGLTFLFVCLLFILSPSKVLSLTCCSTDAECPAGEKCTGPYNNVCSPKPNTCVAPISPLPTQPQTLKCCNKHGECEEGQVCTGPLNYACQQAGYSKTCQNGNLLGCGQPCDINNNLCEPSCPCTGTVSTGYYCNPVHPTFAPPASPVPTLDIHGPCGEDINTAIGCIPTENASAFIKWFLGRAILLAGGIAFLMMIAGAFLVIVSSGNPEKVKAGSQLITSAIAGLVFIIFSLFLLRLIGIEILQIPGL